VLETVARDAATGSMLWTTRTRGRHGEQVFAHAAALSADGARLFVAAEVETDVDTRAALTVAYDTADGSKLWGKRISAGTGRMVIPRRIAVSPDGAAVFVGATRTGTHGSNDFWDFLTAAYAAGTGDRTWTATYDGPAHGGDTVEGLGVRPDGGRVFVTGTSKDAGGDDRDLVTVAYRAADGAVVWTRRHEGGVDDFATDLVVSPDGRRVFVAGYGRASLGDPHSYTVVRYKAANGAPAGSATYANGDDDVASDLSVSPDGRTVFVTGGDRRDYLTVAFRAGDLDVAWAATYNGGHGVDMAYAAAPSSDGAHLYVTGESEEGRVACFGEVPSTAYATLEYDAVTGHAGWVARYAGENRDPDRARSVAPSPDGSLVFVSGDSDTVCHGSDVATVAYQA
jgi:WD40 repeat protein